MNELPNQTVIKKINVTVAIYKLTYITSFSRAYIAKKGRKNVAHVQETISVSYANIDLLFKYALNGT